MGTRQIPSGLGRGPDLMRWVDRVRGEQRLGHQGQDPGRQTGPSIVLRAPGAAGRRIHTVQPLTQRCRVQAWGSASQRRVRSPNLGLPAGPSRPRSTSESRNALGVTAPSPAPAVEWPSPKCSTMGAARLPRQGSRATARSGLGASMQAPRRSPSQPGRSCTAPVACPRSGPRRDARQADDGGSGPGRLRGMGSATEARCRQLGAGRSAEAIRVARGRVVAGSDGWSASCRCSWRG